MNKFKRGDLVRAVVPDYLVKKVSETATWKLLTGHKMLVVVGTYGRVGLDGVTSNYSYELVAPGTEDQKRTRTIHVIPEGWLVPYVGNEVVLEVCGE